MSSGFSGAGETGGTVAAKAVTGQSGGRNPAESGEAGGDGDTKSAPGSDGRNSLGGFDEMSDGMVTERTEMYRGFRVDDVLHSINDGDIHYSIYVPDSYDGSEPYALFITLPGWEGLYFQGVGLNLRDENFAFEAEKYNDRMIIAAPQLNDWGETSADQTIALTEYLLQAYHIDRNKVYLEGYSGGGETGSLAVGKRPDLYTAWLMGSSQWDGNYQTVADAELPVYLAVGENDSYYGAGPLTEAYNTLHDLYVKKGLSEKEINRILVLDVKKGEYFTSRGYQDQHAGGQAFAEDSEIMSWLFSKQAQLRT